MKKTLILPATGLLLVLTACGGGSGGGGGAAGPADASAAMASISAAANATAGTSDGTSGSSTAAVDVCKVLPASDVSRITGTTYTKTKGSSTMGQIFECEYSNAQYALLQISVTVVNGAIGYQSDTEAMSAVQKPIPVSGVGDKAFTVQDPSGNAGAAGVAAFASYGALFGDTFIKIGGSYVTPDQGKQLVEEIHSAM
ncbi:MAG: hypothetical protein QM747_21375 [Nocardioides sp.]